MNIPEKCRRCKFETSCAGLRYEVRLTCDEMSPIEIQEPAQWGEMSYYRIKPRNTYQRLIDEFDYNVRMNINE